MLIEPIIADGGDDAATIARQCLAVAQQATRDGINNPFSVYEDFVRFLADTRSLSVVPLEHLSESSPGSARVALRHDIDSDIVTCIRCARFLAALGLPGTFFVLPTSYYYARVERDSTSVKIIRHDGFRRFFDDLLNTGCEIGLHNDALGYAFDHGVDGAAMVVNELGWLRERGARIRGTSAHNSAAIYGAECFEVFRDLAAENRRQVTFRDRTIALQTLDQTALKLSYEANFPRPRAHIDAAAMTEIQKLDVHALRRSSWQQVYFGAHPIFERGYDCDLWLIGRDTWLFAGGGKVIYPLTQLQAKEKLGALPKGTRCVVTLHTVYVSERDGPS